MSERSEPTTGGKTNGAKANGAKRPAGRANIRAAVHQAAPVKPKQGGSAWPMGFEMRDDGLYRLPAKDDQLPMRLCGPFEIIALTRPETSDDWGLLLTWRDPDGRAHEWNMLRAQLAGDAVGIREHLMARGLWVNSNPAARAHLTDFLTRVSHERIACTVGRVGWHQAEDSAAIFVLPDRMIGPTGHDLVRLTMDPPPTIYAERGSLDAWRRTVAALAVENSRLCFGISTAFAAPLLWLTGDEGGGINLRGESSKGKSTILDAAASVWGAPSKSGPNSFVRPWRATANALENVASQHNHCLLPMDELGEADPRELGESLYMLANGAGKERARATGGNRRNQSWTTLVLSSSEQSAATLAAQGGRQIKAGQEVRLLDVPAVVPHGYGCFETLHGELDGASFSQRVRAAAKAQHGSAGPAFVEWLARQLDQDDDFRARVLAARVSAWRRAQTPEKADGQVIRAAHRMALIAVAGELASEAGITGWAPGEADRAARIIFNDWLYSRGTVGAREEQNLLAALRRFIGAHSNSRFQTMVEPDQDEIGAQVEPPLKDGGRPIMNRAGWRWQEVNERGERQWVHGIIPEVFTAEIAEPCGIEHREARAKLGGAGFLRGQKERDGMRWATRPRRIPGEGQPRMIVVAPRIMEDAAE